MKKNLVVGQSGGPTSAINSSLAGVIKAGLESQNIVEVIGVRYGIEGILNENFVSLSKFSDEKMLDLLIQTPSAYLGSCRKKLPDVSENQEMYDKIFDVFEKNNIGYFFYIGGNDSMDTVNKLSLYAKEKNYDIKVIGIPKTIDNDLYKTDHTPGFGSAAKFVANSVKQISHDNNVYDMDSVTIVEIMGRNAGWLAASAVLANDESVSADIICLPEISFDMDKLIGKINEKVKEKRTVVVALSEGVKDCKGKYLCEYVSKTAEQTDIFNHKQMGGAGKCLENYIKDDLGYKVRTVELSSLQRCFSYSGSKDDFESGFKIGYEGVKKALEGVTGVMMAFNRISDEPYEYEITYADVNEVANFEKMVPIDMITDDGFGLNEKFIKYAKPLISGEFIPQTENGIIKTLRV